MIALYRQKRGHMGIYCLSAQTIGWMLLIIPAIVVVRQLAGAVRFGDNRLRDILYILLLKWPLTLQVVFVNFMLPGILLVIVARFIRYLNDDDEYKPGWLLRHGSAILYTCAILVLAGYIGGLIKGFNYMTGISATTFSLISSNWVLSALPSIGIVLILVGAGHALRRIMPVTTESKSLVKSGTIAGSEPQREVTDPNKIECLKGLPSGKKKYVFTAIIILGLITLGTLCYILTRPADRANSFYLRNQQTGKLIGPVIKPKGHIPLSSNEQSYIVIEPTESELEVRKRLLRPRVKAALTDIPLSEALDHILTAYFGNKVPPVRIVLADESKMPRVSIDARDLPLYEVLFNIASKANVYVFIENDTIVLSEKEFNARQLLMNTNQSKTDDSSGMPKPEISVPAQSIVVQKIKCEPKILKLLLDKDNASCPKLTLRSLDDRPFSITSIRSPANCITAEYDPNVKATEFVLEPKVNEKKLKNPKGRLSIGLNHPDGNILYVLFGVLPEHTINPPMLVVLNAEPKRPLVKKVSVKSNYGTELEIESVSSNNNVVGIKILEQVKFRNGYQLDLEITPPAANDKPKFLDEFSVNLKDGKKLTINCNGYYSKENPE